MSIRADLDAASEVLTIAIEGRFDFSAHKEFRESYEDVDSNPAKYSIDMRDANLRVCVVSRHKSYMLLIRMGNDGEDSIFYL